MREARLHGKALQVDAGTEHDLPFGIRIEVLNDDAPVVTGVEWKDDARSQVPNGCRYGVPVRFQVLNGCRYGVPVRFQVLNGLTAYRELRQPSRLWLAMSVGGA